MFLTNCSWSAHILMVSVLIPRNLCNRHLLLIVIFLNFKLFIQSITLRYTSVENFFNHVKIFYSFYAHFSHNFGLRFRPLKSNNNNNNKKDFLIAGTNTNNIKEYSFENTIHKKLAITTNS